MKLSPVLEAEFLLVYGESLEDYIKREVREQVEALMPLHNIVAGFNTHTHVTHGEPTSPPIPAFPVSYK